MKPGFDFKYSLLFVLSGYKYHSMIGFLFWLAFCKLGPPIELAELAGLIVFWLGIRLLL